MHLRINGNDALRFRVEGLSADELKSKLEQSMKDGTPLTLDVQSENEEPVQMLLNPNTLNTVEISFPEFGTTDLHR